MNASSTFDATRSGQTAAELRHLTAEVGIFCGLGAASFVSESHRYNAVVAGMHALCARIDESLAAGAAPAVVRGVVGPAAALQAGSPFIRRLQEWPRGYPGDFETIEYILEGRNRAVPRTLAYACEHYALNSAPSYQHRNKVALQAECIREVCAEVRGPRILVLAAGGGADIAQALPDLIAAGAKATVNDFDADALATCQQRLVKLGPDVSFVPGSALVLARALAAIGPFDLILAGGLFDYLSDALVRRLFRTLAPSLAPGGRVMFSNVAADNPYRSWMRFCVDWNLIERDEAEVQALSLALGPRTTTTVRRDVSGLSLVVSCKREV